MHMSWAGLIVAGLVGLVGLGLLHFWWRKRFDLAQADWRRQIERVQEEQRQSAHQIQAQQAALLNSMAEGLLVLDQQGRIQLANQAFTNLFGISTDLRSRTIMEALRLHELAGLVELLRTEKQILDYELKVSRPAERWLQISGAAVFNGGGERAGTILVFHDLTRLKKLESARQEFVANVSHELRTPLSLIKGYVETLLEGAKDNPEVATKFLKTIDRNAERLKLLIEDLLTISELESGRLKLNCRSLALRPMIEKVLVDFKARAGTKRIQLVDAADAVQVQADPDRLEQVLGNLVDNAIKYGRVEGLVTIGARKTEDGQVEVCVQDDGPGIPAEALERVFERFYRVDKARSREQGGTGLGLSIVKHIIQNHQGRVWARSESGKGAAFYFTLPA
jgi:two-component system, OmpR family, phosphate regulon sensor histidine kinase PhoR